jgi:hypothetical protein
MTLGREISFGGTNQKRPAFADLFVMYHGAVGGIRTPDPRFTKALLYP